MAFLKDKNDYGLLVGGVFLAAAGLAVVAPFLPASAGSAQAGTAQVATVAAPYAPRTYDEIAKNGLIEVAFAPYTGEDSSIIRPAAEVPAPVAARDPQVVQINLESIERMGELADGTTYRYWTFNGQVPGPFFRVRVGDMVEVNLHNQDDSWMAHNVDFHAVTGPGGGGVATVTDPGHTNGFRFQALNPGLYVYHCAVPTAAQPSPTACTG